MMSNSPVQEKTQAFRQLDNEEIKYYYKLIMDDIKYQSLLDSQCTEITR